jgi:hypothetical protein
MLLSYGKVGVSDEIYTEKGFKSQSVNTQQKPRFTGRFVVDAITQYLQDLGFELSRRDYTSYKHEMINRSQPLDDFGGALQVYKTYAIQVMYLNIEGNLRYFLVVAPKLHFEFGLSLKRYASKVNCQGRYLKVVCPSECNVYDCKLHPWRGSILGRFDGFTSNGFECEYLPDSTAAKSYVSLTDSRLEGVVGIPEEICQIEASLGNIRYLFESVWPPKKVRNLMTKLRVLSGDLQAGGRVNKEVGRKRYEDCLEVVRQVSRINVFGSEICVTDSPMRALEGAAMVSQEHEFGLEDEDDEFESSPF